MTDKTPAQERAETRAKDWIAAHIAADLALGIRDVQKYPILKENAIEAVKTAQRHSQALGIGQAVRAKAWLHFETDLTEWGWQLEAE